jgi:hypothetical protein
MVARARLPRVPPENAYLARLLSLKEFATSGLPLTEKARHSLLSAFRLSAQENNYVYDDTILRGQLVAFSALVPALETLRANPHALYTTLSDAPLGADTKDEDDHFEEEFRDLRGRHRCISSQPYRVLSLAHAIAREQGYSAIDSSTIARALLQQALYIDADLGHHALRSLSRMTLTDQIDGVLKARGHDPLLPSRTLRELFGDLETMDEWNPMFEPLAKHLPDIAALRRLEYSLAYARSVEPYIEFSTDALVFEADRIRVRRCDYIAPMTTGTTSAEAMPLKVSVLRGGGTIARADLQEFEELINRAGVSEEQLQRFFERHPGFLLGDRYTHLYSKLALFPGDIESPIPDFFAEGIGAGVADIIELKLPNVPLIVGPKRRRGFSAALTQALNQVREYRSVFEDPSHRQRFQDAYGVKAFRPDVCVVIGRSHSFTTPEERISITDEYRNLKLLTYDDILHRARLLTSL